MALAVWARALSCSVGAGIVLQCGRGHCPAVWARALSCWGARFSSVVRAFAHGAMVRRIDPS